MSQKINLPYLEWLTTRELSSLAGNFDIDIPPGFDRTLVIGELLECAPCLSLYRQEFVGEQDEVLHLDQPDLAPLVKTLLDVPPPVPLPKQYAFTYLDVLIRDPFWVYVFWEISGSDRKRYEQKQGFSAYNIRVLLTDCASGEGRNTILSAHIENFDDFRYLNFPGEEEWGQFYPKGTDCAYRVELCAILDNEEFLLVSSRPFRMPKTPVLPEQEDAEIAANPILKLSGILDLPVYSQFSEQKGW
ncbi:MAG: DUF4912 domain-containing protein [Spirochaetaceae bacterium]|jgi:hypothetical protein|nr:DUF4912 domain-containing protein [Spirochaetaceae bacterium]